jgi:hypothetical protein
LTNPDQKKTKLGEKKKINACDKYFAQASQDLMNIIFIRVVVTCAMCKSHGYQSNCHLED